MRIARLLVAASITFFLCIDGTAVRARRSLHQNYGIAAGILNDGGANAAEALGVGYVRLDFPWHLVEPSDNNFYWDDIDRYVDNATSRGLKIFATLSGTPDWANPNPNCDNNSQDHPKACFPDVGAWQDYVSAVLNHFSYLGSDITFGIWNEPNLSKFLIPSGPVGYSALFYWAAVARASTNPSARFGAPDLFTQDEPGGSAADYLETVMANISDDMEPQDVITFHYYPSNSNYRLNDIVDEILEITDGREVWLTEYGFSTQYDWLQASKMRDVVGIFNNRYRSEWTLFFPWVLLDGNNNGALMRNDESKRPSYYV